jgi:hypothetical protein
MPFHSWSGPNLELVVHVQPGASRTESAGIHGGALKIRVRARATEGAANDALLDFVAESLQTPRRRCVLVSGHKSRRKRILVEGPDRAVAEDVLFRWLQTSS